MVFGYYIQIQLRSISIVMTTFKSSISPLDILDKQCRSELANIVIYWIEHQYSYKFHYSGSYDNNNEPFTVIRSLLGGSVIHIKPDKVYLFDGVLQDPDNKILIAYDTVNAADPKLFMKIKKCISHFL